MFWSRILVAAVLSVTGCQRSKPEQAPPVNENEQSKGQLHEAKDESPMSQDRDLDSILIALHDADEKTRESAKVDLFRLRLRADKLTIRDGTRALREAAKPYPFEKPDRDELSERLVDIAATQPRPEYIPLVVELFDKFSDGGKWWALVILTSLEELDAAKAFMDVVRLHAKAGRVPRLAVGPLVQKPRHAAVVFPELLEFASNDTLRADIYRLCLAYAEAGLLEQQTLAGHIEQMLDAYNALAGKLKSAQKAEGISWMWDESYSKFRFDAGLMLDLLAYFPASKVEPTLRKALDYRDPRLKFFAIASLLKLGKQIDVKQIAEVASHAEMRNFLFNSLQKHGKSALYPAKFKTQAAFAESDMVNWLTYPTELGRVPDEIELMKVVPIDTGLPGGIYEYYLFRFRTHPPHWAAKDGWMAGVSGPFLRGQEPNTNSLGDTFSTFSKWDSKKPEDHVGDIKELMKEWREYHGKKRQD